SYYRIVIVSPLTVSSDYRGIDENDQSKFTLTMSGGTGGYDGSDLPKIQNATVTTKQGTTVTQAPLGNYLPQIYDVQVSNLRDNGATISWITGVPSYGLVQYSTQADLNTYEEAYHDLLRGEVNCLALSSVHSVDLPSPAAEGNFSPGTTYYYRVISWPKDILPQADCLISENLGSVPSRWKNQSALSSFKTLGQFTSGQNMISGQVLDLNSKPLEGALIRLLVSGANPISTLTESGGQWSLNLGNLKTTFGIDIALNPGDPVTMVIQGAGHGYLSTPITYKGGSVVDPAVINLYEKYPASRPWPQLAKRVFIPATEYFDYTGQQKMPLQGVRRFEFLVSDFNFSTDVTAKPSERLTITDPIEIHPDKLLIDEKGVMNFSADGGSLQGFTWSFTGESSDIPQYPAKGSIVPKADPTQSAFTPDLTPQTREGKRVFSVRATDTSFNNIQGALGGLLLIDPLEIDIKSSGYIPSSSGAGVEKNRAGVIVIDERIQVALRAYSGSGNYAWKILNGAGYIQPTADTGPEIIITPLNGSGERTIKIQLRDTDPGYSGTPATLDIVLLDPIQVKPDYLFIQDLILNAQDNTMLKNSLGFQVTGGFLKPGDSSKSDVTRAKSEFHESSGFNIGVVRDEGASGKFVLTPYGLKSLDVCPEDIKTKQLCNEIGLRTFTLAVYPVDANGEYKWLTIDSPLVTLGERLTLQGSPSSWIFPLDGPKSVLSVPWLKQRLSGGIRTGNYEFSIEGETLPEGDCTLTETATAGKMKCTFSTSLQFKNSGVYTVGVREFVSDNPADYRPQEFSVTQEVYVPLKVETHVADQAGNAVITLQLGYLTGQTMIVYAIGSGNKAVDFDELTEEGAKPTAQENKLTRIGAPEEKEENAQKFWQQKFQVIAGGTIHLRASDKNDTSYSYAGYSDRIPIIEGVDLIGTVAVKNDQGEIYTIWPGAVNLNGLDRDQGLSRETDEYGINFTFPSLAIGSNLMYTLDILVPGYEPKRVLASADPNDLQI
ncbi:MAG: fibronectin type III domain-containing protein, partial [Candidatus Tectomicrobia bacterium]|nr:fibronectin type III domain-containing protein [Candidatus Tectomicrobia bacterium]